MNLYLISQTENRDYDTYDSAVVCAPNENAAQNMNPSDGKPIVWDAEDVKWCGWYWCSSPKGVKVEFLGKAYKMVPEGILCASFRSG